MFAVLLLLFFHCQCSHTESPGEDVVPDISQDPFLFVADRLPTTSGTVNLRYLPAVANGHLATIVYSDTIYVNGIYNGKGKYSYRARIPSYHAIKLMPNDSTSPRRYSFNVTNGLFKEVISSPRVTVTYQTYAHLFYNRILLSDVEITRNKSQGPVIVDWQSLQGDPTRDFKLSHPAPYKTEYLYQNGTTMEAESPDTDVVPAHIYWSPYPKRFYLGAKDNSRRYCFAISIDQTKIVSQDNFKAVMAFSAAGKCQDLLDNHTLLWQQRWSEGQMDIEYEKPTAHLLHLRKVLLSSQYYIYSNLPSSSTFRPNNQFYGLSPGGLSTGTNGSDYYGHVFWDMDTWMYPTFLVMRPDLAKEMLSYRLHTLNAGYANAKKSGFKGVRYPWESGFSGHEVSPSDDCGNYEIHITGDVAFAAMQYLWASRDKGWLNDAQNTKGNTGYELLLEAARYWVSRAMPNKQHKYDINHIMPPDEVHFPVNNSIYTNTVAYLSVFFAAYAGCLGGRNASDVPREWRDIVSNLTFTYNKQKQYHEEFQNFDHLNQTGKLGYVKQADVILLSYPFNMNYPKSVKLNDLNFYEALTNPLGPDMTWAMFAVRWLELDNVTKAAKFFNQSYNPYVREPFKIWTEVVGGVGAVNFQTGMGGFHQAVMFGYGGLRLEAESLVFRKPLLIPNTSRLLFKKLDYLGTVFDYTVEVDSVCLKVYNVGNIALKLKASGTVSDLKPGMVVLKRDTFSIFPSKPTGCRLPPDSLPIKY